MQVEQQIIATTCDITPNDGRLEKLYRLMSGSFDAASLIDMSVKEGVACLLYKNLKKAGALEKLDQRSRQKFQSFYYMTVRSNLKLLHELKHILQHLNQNNLQAVLLQGVALLPQIYKDVGLRPLTDIDLWVLPQHRHALGSTLINLGFQRDPVYADQFQKGTIIVDINTHISWANRIKARQSLLSRSQKDIYAHIREIEIEGEKALCLSPPDQLIYLCLHALKHNLSRIIWLVDIQALLADWETADWQALLIRARELGQEKTLSYILFLLWQIFDYSPAAAAAATSDIYKVGCLEKKVLKTRRVGNSLPMWSPLILFPSNKGLIERLTFFFENLFPRPEILRQVFAGSPHLKTWQLYWRRGLQLLRLNRTF